jgi:hypothetical protein
MHNKTVYVALKATQNNSMYCLNEHTCVIKKLGAGCHLLAPVILATQEAEIRMIAVQSHPGQKVLETLSQNK